MEPKRTMAARRTNPDFLNGVPEMLLLRLLKDQPQYGYQLVRAIREGSGGGLEFGEGAIYPILHRLEQDGLLRSRRESVNGRSRIVYRLTRAGSQRLEGVASRWEEVVRSVNLLLHGGEDGHEPVAEPVG
jgi:PadR family transcriptional regulator